MRSALDEGVARGGEKFPSKACHRIGKVLGRGVVLGSNEGGRSFRARKNDFEISIQKKRKFGRVLMRGGTIYQ